MPEVASCPTHDIRYIHYEDMYVHTSEYMCWPCVEWALSASARARAAFASLPLLENAWRSLDTRACTTPERPSPVTRTWLAIALTSLDPARSGQCFFVGCEASTVVSSAEARFVQSRPRSSGSSSFGARSVTKVWMAASATNRSHFSPAYAFLGNLGISMGISNQEDNDHE